MARWKILTSMYLNTVDSAEWEYIEANRTTGKPMRKKFNVPRLIDPRAPGDWTHKWGFKDDADGECVLCQPGKGEANDIEFLGDPTPDMIPLDDEARAISAGFAERWRYKPEGSAITYSQALVDEFESEMADTQSKPAPPVQIEGLADLVAVMAQQAEATQAILASLASNRRV